jgi:hypothetical protein
MHGDAGADVNIKSCRRSRQSSQIEKRRVLVIDYLDTDSIGNTAGQKIACYIPTFNLHIARFQASNYWIARASKVSIDKQVFCTSVVITVCSFRQQITGCHPCTLCKRCVFIEVAPKLGGRGEQQKQDWQYNCQLHQLHAALVSLETGYFPRKLSEHIKALSVEHRLYNWRTRIKRSGRIVNATTNDDGGTNIFSLYVEATAASNLASQEESAEMVDLDGGATVLNLVYLHYWQ